MANDVLAFQGGSIPETEAEGQKVMEQWMSWFGALGWAPLGSGGTVFVLRGDAHWMTVERVFGAAHRRNEFSS